ncbi:DUF5333 domain-containing protein [Octadecabacter sp. 1_MG-2023]|uniref:DUF5333 domain-containing protein n=1 Tax=unclassified Octadecabacter TaxID=196158 RepID=UPI001C08129E|nr:MULTISPECIES: DUF5333 domain-containing protein [unclassified Octadecabacter]MBU2993810.1 DUF5333 domain-containing protein [Octadecabacter sp. B2R22]MDO6735345.1 DUF5333 domain-containing protein [Octadecabacter sp. 1_MG-2023]
MKTKMTWAMAATIAMTLSGTASANPGNVERVTEGLIAAGMAIELDDHCGSVSVRMIRGLNFLQGLKRHLSDLGYSNSEIDQYIDNDAEKDRLEAIARQRLADLGVRRSDPSTYCTVARSQMAAGTQVGQLLR